LELTGASKELMEHFDCHMMPLLESPMLVYSLLYKEVELVQRQWVKSEGTFLILPFGELPSFYGKLNKIGPGIENTSQ
jgi:hypothetical protein